MPRSPATLITAALCVALIAGCGWVPRSQWTAVQSQNKSLAEQSRAQLVEIDNLKNHQRSIEDQLLQAEDELAFLDDQYGIGVQKEKPKKRDLAIALTELLAGKEVSVPVTGSVNGAPPVSLGKAKQAD